jgi:hypothetical protein
MADFRGEIGGDDPDKLIRCKGVLPDIPGRELVFLVYIGVERRAYGKQQPAAV